MTEDPNSRGASTVPKARFGFNLDQLFRIATKFFKDNEGKVFHPSYDDRNRFLALVLQAKHGAFDASKASSLGAFDIVGHDRRKAWALLGKLNSEEAKLRFIDLLESSCPTFKLFVEAHQKEKEEREKMQNGIQRAINPNYEHKSGNNKGMASQGSIQGNFKDTHQIFMTDEQRHAIKEWLNSQTYHEFRKIAAEIYTSDTERQLGYIRKLQDQHFEQFIRQQPHLFMEMNGKPGYPCLAESSDSPLLKDREHHVSYNSTATPSNSMVSGDMNTPASFNVDTLRGTLEELIANEKLNDPVDVETVEEKQSKDLDESEFDLEAIEAPQMWTGKEIKAFKESIREANEDGMIKVGHGEILTIRVPTYPDGSKIFWEFATDSYDIGFGLYFEWTKNPGNQVSVHITDTEDENEDEDEMISSVVDVAELPHDPESGSHKIDLLNDEVPTSILIPSRRRESHEEVIIGSHAYPGKGAYLLKFDNTFSLWRSKTLYYRIYYDKK